MNKKEECTMSNLLTTYLAIKGLEAMSKESGSGSGHYYQSEPDVVKPSKEQIEKVLNEQRNNIAIANHVKNLHTSRWDHCSRRVREPADNKTQKIVLKHCRENGMTREQQKEVEKLAQQYMGEVKPWKRMDKANGSISALTDNVKMVVIPDDFTVRQQQYLCACLKEYGMDTVVFAKESGKEAFVMTFNAIDFYGELSPSKYTYSFPGEHASMRMSEQNKSFCRPYDGSRRYMELHIKAQEGLHMNLEALKIVINEMNTDRFSNAYCSLPYGMKLFEPDIVPQVEQDNITTMNGGDAVLNGTEQLSVPENKEDVVRDDLDI